MTGATQGAHGTVTFTATGVTYAPAANYNGADSFTYTIGDGNGGSASATVNVTVTGVNDNPVLATTQRQWLKTAGPTRSPCSSMTMMVPIHGESLQVTAVTQGAHGTVTFTATGVTYTPAANYNGADSFTYTISDGNGGSASATVNVTVTGVNDNPVDTTDAATLPEDSSATLFNVLTNDNLGPDVGETLTVTGPDTARMAP